MERFVGDWLQAASAEVSEPQHQDELACLVCASRVADQSRLPYLERQFSHLPVRENPFAALEVRVCPRCGFGWAVPAVAPARLEAFYRTAYRGEGSAHHVSDPLAQTAAPFDPRAVSQLLLAKMFRSFSPGEAALDVGPGYGASFGALARLIPGLQPFACEPDPSARRFLQDAMRVHVLPQSFSADPSVHELVDGRVFHLVLMSHVVEHFNGQEVIAVLKNVRRLLADDGLLVCEVPHCDLRRHAERRMNDTPHLAFFSVESLRAALVHAGFSVKFLQTCSQLYDVWWSDETADGPCAAPPLAEPRLRRLAKRGYRALHSRLPRSVRNRLDALRWSARLDALCRSDELSYGGDRTCLRAVASPT